MDRQIQRDEKWFRFRVGVVPTFGARFSFGARTLNMRFARPYTATPQGYQAYLKAIFQAHVEMQFVQLLQPAQNFRNWSTGANWQGFPRIFAGKDIL
jgi:hypothetical protein